MRLFRRLAYWRRLRSNHDDTAIAGAGVVAFRAADRANNRAGNDLALEAVVVGVPVLQLLSAVIIELRTSRR